MADAPRSTAAPIPKGDKGGPDPLIGRVINDRFRVTSVIARGGMGKVYRAEQAPLGREVALKILNPNYSGDHDPEFHKRFFLEASICSKLTHPNTVTIFDYGRTDDDVYYIAMELLEGRTLHRALRDEGAFEQSRVMHVARQVCRSLREAHGLGVIHRDLKPANVFLVRHGDETDFVKVLDFGLVKNVEEKGEDLTQTGLFMGSPKYMSPEQIRGERVDARADIYALGVIMYEMLTARVPFDRPNSVNILMAHVHEKVPPMREMKPDLQCSAALEAVVLKCMAKTPEERFKSMDELLVGLKQAATESGFQVSRSGEANVSGEFPALSGSSGTGSFPPVELRGDPMSGSTPSSGGTPLGGQGPISGVVSPGTPSSGVPTQSPSMTPSGAVSVPLAFGSGPVTPITLGEPERSSRAPLYIVGGLATVAAVAIGVYFATRGPDEAAPSDPTAGAPTTQTTGTGSSPSSAQQQTTPQNPAPPEARVIVSLRSEPDGAMVAVGEREYGPTPAEIEWTGDDAARDREVTFRFHKEGFQDMTVIRTISGDRLDVEARLEAIARQTPIRRPIRRPGQGGTEAGTGPVGPIKGYKTDPY